MISTLKYTLRIISILLLWSNALFVAAEEKKAKEDKEQKRLFYGFSVDLDLMEPFFSVINSNRFGVNASVQADIFRTVFPIFEMGYSTYEGASYYSYPQETIVQPGNENLPSENENYRYHVNGTYYKIGLDFNLLSKNYTKNIIPLGYLGIRYCVSPLNYRIENFKINDSYWGETEYFNKKGSSVAQWAEFVAGVKTPVYKNFCLGVSVQFKQFLVIKENQEENNTSRSSKVVRSSFAPGFGEKENDVWGFRYTISYFFPFTK